MKIGHALLNLMRLELTSGRSPSVPESDGTRSIVSAFLDVRHMVRKVFTVPFSNDEHGHFGHDVGIQRCLRNYQLDPNSIRDNEAENV